MRGEGTRGIGEDVRGVGGRYMSITSRRPRSGRRINLQHHGESTNTNAKNGEYFRAGDPIRGVPDPGPSMPTGPLSLERTGSHQNSCSLGRYEQRRTL